MLVRTFTIMAGPDGNRQPGVHDLPDDEAMALVAGGYAEHVEPAPDEAELEAEEAAEAESGNWTADADAAHAEVETTEATPGRSRRRP